MRILQITPYFAPAYSYGGPPETVHKLSQALAKLGHEVTVLTTDAFSSTKRQSLKHETNSLDVYYLRNLSNYLAWNHQLFLPLGTRGFLRKRGKNFDIIHLHSFRTYQNVVAWREARHFGTPYVFSAHGSIPRIVRKRLAKSLFDVIAGRRFLHDASRLIAVSRAELLQYREMGVSPSKIVVIPNGIDAGQYSQLPPRGSFSSQWGLNGKKLITYVGRLNRRKGLDTLLDAFRKLCNDHSDLMLVLVGPDDGYRGQIQRRTRLLSLGDRVVLTGLITLPEKLAVLSDSDVVVYPGSYEIFGLVPFEALLCGRPVVVADDSGCGEIIAEARGGITFPVGEASSLAEAISTALSGGDSIKAMIERGRSFVLKEMEWGRIAKDTEYTYQIAIREHLATREPTRPAEAT